MEQHNKTHLDHNSTTEQYKNAAKALIARVLPSKADLFSVEISTSETEKDFFEIESRYNRIILRGNTPVSIASALNWYLKYQCNCHISWNSSQLALPNPLPFDFPKIRQDSPFVFRAYLNYCTFSYTMPWWNWERWQWEIDWMALHGVNMPLAITGQEAVWQATLRKLGLDDETIREFLVGPSYFAWQWMDNLEGWMGPLPQHWIDTHLTLGRQIVQRERELGMTPILKGFSGYVPMALGKQFPQASIYKTNWISTFDTTQLDPLDPLFPEIAETFYREQEKLFGTDHYYSLDPFHESQPPVRGPEYLEKAGAAIFEAAHTIDEKAVLAIQTWSLREGLLRSIPKDRTLMLAITGTNWKKHESYWGRPWLVGMMHNFGGRSFTGGNLQHFLQHALTLNKLPEARNVQGTGVFPEAIEHNPIIYEAVSEIAWHKSPPAINEWVIQYTRARYGSLPPAAKQAWSALLQTVYQQKKVKIISMESPICARPALQILRISMNGEMVRDYNLLQLWMAWENLLDAAVDLGDQHTFQYDVVDVSRQCLADLSILLHKEITTAYADVNTAYLRDAGDRFLTLMADMDHLLGSRAEFLLGKWLYDARSWGTTEEERNAYEKAARTLITVWGPVTPNALFFDYSHRQWSGLISGFYKPRWEKFIDYLIHQPPEGEKRYREKRLSKSYDRPANNANDFFEELSRWEHRWTEGNEAYTAVPLGEPIDISRALYKKWSPIMQKLMGEKPFIQQEAYLDTVIPLTQQMNNFGL